MLAPKSVKKNYNSTQLQQLTNNKFTDKKTTINK